MKKQKQQVQVQQSTKLPDFATDKVRSVHLEDKAREEYYEYGLAVIEDRAIFNGLDGLIPVTRRSLWAAHELGLHHKVKRDKSAKIVGTTLAAYHPHGDVACYGAIVNAGSNCQPLFDTKEGNWGTMTEPAAAYRYTNTRLSKYSDLVMFDPFYLPAIEFVPNYDGSGKEPLILPTLLPNALLNGNFGIAPGVNTRSPAITIDSLIPLLQMTLKNGECSPKDCGDLKITTRYGGVARQSSAERRRDCLNFYKTGKGKITFDSTCVELSSTEIRFNRFAPIGDIQKLLVKVESIKGVVKASDDSDKKDPFGTAYKVKLTKGLKEEQRIKVIKQVRALFAADWNFNIKVTDRFVKPDGTGGAKLRHNTVPQMIKEWVLYRLQLERKACEYWIKDLDKKIKFLELMRQAIKHIDLIVKCLKDKSLSSTELDVKVAEGLGVTTEEAKAILDKPIRQLRALEDADLVAKIKEHEESRSKLEGRKAKPAKYVHAQVGEFLTVLTSQSRPTKD